MKRVTVARMQRAATVRAAVGLTATLLVVPFAPPGGAATIAPGRIASGSRVFAPAVRPTQTIAPAVMASGSTVRTPSVAPVAAVAIAPTKIAGTSTMLAPTLLTGAQIVAPSVLSGETTVRAPTIALSAAKTVAPTMIVGGSLVRAPVVALEAPNAVAPASIASGSNVRAPAVGMVAAKVVAPISIASGSVVRTPTVVVAAPATLPNFRNAMAAAQAGTAGPLVINMIGDSTIAGAGAGTGTPTTLIANNPRAGSISQRLADAFSSLGLSRNGADVFGWNLALATGTQADYASFNSAVTPGGWDYVPSSSWRSLGGSLWRTTGNNGDFQWTAEGRPFDKLIVYPGRSSGDGTIGVFIDGTQVATVSCNGTLSIGRSEIAVPLGVHTVALRLLTGGSSNRVSFAGLETIDSTNKASVRIRNLGQSSGRSADLSGNQNGFDWRNALAVIDAAALHIIEAGMINDWRAAVTPATTASNASTIATAAQTKGGDVLFLGATRGAPSNGSNPTAATMQATVDAVAALANGTTRLAYDLLTATGDYAAMSAAGRMFDTIHPNLAGYNAQAVAIRNYLTG